MSRVFNRYGFGATNFIFGASALLLLLLIMPHAHAADINVPAGGNLQQAIDNAQPGDTINLAAGATFVGTFVLPQKVGDAWITIQSSALAQLPGAGVRVTPSHAAMMPKIVSGGLNAPALRTEAGAHHYRLIGIEIRTTDDMAYVDDLVLLGNNTEQTTLESVPHHLVMDRCLVTAFPNQRLKRGIALNSAHTDIINSHIAGFKVVGQDAQAIAGFNGPGPFNIINNYLEGAGENVLFGGDDAKIPGLVPSDIVIRRNHFFKPLSWKVGHPTYAGNEWSVKNLFELKSARRVLVEGNLMENNWGHSQVGYAVLFTVRSQDGGNPWAVVEDVVFRHNIVRHSASAFQLLKTDYNGASGETTRIQIYNNVWDDIDGAKWNGAGWFMTGAIDDITIDHNTIFHTGNIASIPNDVFTGNVFTNNIVNRNDYGFHVDGLTETGLPQVMPDLLLQKNIIVNGAGKYPNYPDNFTNLASMSQVGFVNLVSGNYRLATGSPYRNAGTDGKDVGADIDQLEGVMNNQIQPPPPVWAPTITFNASSLYFMPGTSLTLSWMTENATGVSINQGIGAVPASGSLIVAPTQTTTYVLTAQGIGGTATKSVTVNLLPTGNTYQASSDFSDTQGLRNWSYLYGGNNPMTFDPYTKQWRGTQQYMLLWANGGHPGSYVDVTRRWTAHATGSIRITGSSSDANSNGGDGVVVSISKGSTVLWQQTINNGDTTGFSYDLANTVVAGDTLDFTINRRGNDGADNTNFDPTIVFTPANTLAPIADAYVKGADAFVDMNFGTAADLQVKRTLNMGSGNGRQSYLRFDTSSVTGTISRATLRVYGKLNAMVGANQNIPCAVFPVSDSTWTETGITWNNKPAPNVPSELTRVTVTDDVLRWYEFDITTFINQERAAGRSVTGVLLRNMTNGEVGDYYTVFNSREAASNQPQLVIQQ